MAVFVIDNQGNPLMPCSEGHARKLLERGKAQIHRFFPFSIRLIDQSGLRDGRQDLILKISPGSESTGFSLVCQEGESTRVIYLAELVHRGWSIVKSLYLRRAFRRRRRSNNLRYRPPRFSNRRKPSTWLPPSILHRVETVTTWIHRFSQLAPVTSIVAELDSLDPQERLVEFAIRAHRDKGRSKSQLRCQVYGIWGRKCIYCETDNVPLELDHIVPRLQGGSNRPSNLVPACRVCNKKKGVLSIQRFLADRPELLKKIQSKMKQPMREAAALEAMRRGLRRVLARGPMPLAISSTDSRRSNAERLALPSTPALNAACAGITGTLTGWKQPVLRIECIGRGSYRRTGSFIPGRKKGDHRNRQFFRRKKFFNGFRTGDVVKAEVTSGKHPGVYRSRIAVRASGGIELKTINGKIQTRFTRCRLIQRADGYSYSIIKSPRMGSSQVGTAHSLSNDSDIVHRTKGTENQ
jgi:5-methylcytosine-specific restriction endonuclease McrA